MSFEAVTLVDDDKASSYQILLEQARILFAGESNRIANAANLSALIFNSLPDLNWAGFYFMDGEELVVGPFQGMPACVRIAMGRGVCGTAAQTRSTQRIDDVDLFDGHIACDSASRSELAVPLVHQGTLVGVLDIDSPIRSRFDDQDQQGMEQLAAAYVACIDQP